jgi:hypothetical protein
MHACSALRASGRIENRRRPRLKGAPFAISARARIKWVQSGIVLCLPRDCFFVAVITSSCEVLALMEYCRQLQSCEQSMRTVIYRGSRGGLARRRCGGIRRYSKGGAPQEQSEQITAFMMPRGSSVHPTSYHAGHTVDWGDATPILFPTGTGIIESNLPFPLTAVVTQQQVRDMDHVALAALNHAWPPST